jgi:phosphoserine phosphatase
MVSVIIPALNEARTIASVVALARQDPAVSEVLVVDDGSTDGTAGLARAAGATVLTSTLLGKGASMEDGLRAARHELLLFLDGDLSGLRPDLIGRMTAPLLRGEADFVKARFSRAAGRVTALTAGPLLRLLFPELAHFQQPLSGVVAARRCLLGRLHFENDYGVDVGLFLDAASAGARLAEVDIGHLEHDSRPLECLRETAAQVARAILERAARAGRLRQSQLLQVEEDERHAQAQVAAVLSRLGKVDRLALFDMDGVLLDGRFVVSLARRARRTAELARLLDKAEVPAEERSERIAALFAGVSREAFEETARDMPLMAGAAETVVSLRKAGYRVGVVTDSYLVAAEVVRRRVFADFSVAHLMRFDGRKASGILTLAPLMIQEGGCRLHGVCKVNVMARLVKELGIGTDRVLAVGDGENDICLLRGAGTSVAFRPKSPAVRAAAGHVVTGPLSGVLAFAGLDRPVGKERTPCPTLASEPGKPLDVAAWG